MPIHERFKTLPQKSVLQGMYTGTGDRQMGMKKLLLKIKVLMFKVITQIRSNSDGDCTGVRWFGLSQ